MASASILNEQRNIFEVDNARNQYEQQLPATFVPTEIYWRLFSAKNQVLVGTRGSGKTAVLKMLSLPYLLNFEDDTAYEFIRRQSFLGIYIPVTTLWLGPIKSRLWANSEEKGREFLWHFSIAACQALTKTIEAALSAYIRDAPNRLAAHAQIISRLTLIWFPGDAATRCASFQDLRERLGQLPLEKNLFESSQFLNPQDNQAAKFLGGTRFYSPVLDAFLHGVAAVQTVLGLSDDKTSWLICLDEVETLDADCQAVINSFMRSDFGNRYFKIATLPYAHKTLRTNLDAPLQVGHDFEYVWMDDDPATHENALRGAVGDYTSSTFARMLYNKRRSTAAGAYSRYNLDRLLGKNSILSPVELLQDSRRHKDASTIVHTFEELAKDHFNELTLRRTLRLRRIAVASGDDSAAINSEFGDQVLRKALGFLLLRDAIRARRGSTKIDVYSGAEMLIRLADGNPRTMIRLLNSMLRNSGWESTSANPVISRSHQHETSTRFSKAVVERTRSEEEVGQALYGLLTRIGSGLRGMFHNGRIGSDFVGQVIFDSSQFGQFRLEIELGIQLGLLRVDIRPGADFVLPTDGGTFRLSYCLSPAFSLVPRRGRPASLLNVIGSGPIEQPGFDFSAPA
jgi:hypothetical protein